MNPPMMLVPDEVDWTELDDAAVYYAAQADIPQAIAEQKRRERD